MFDPVTQHAVKLHREKDSKKYEENVVRKEYDADQVYECPKCGASFKSKEDLSSHIESSHRHFPHGPFKD